MHVISIINHMVLQSIRQLCPPHLHFSNNPSLLGLLRSLHTSEQLHTAAIKKPKQTCHKPPFYFPRCNPATSNHTYLKFNIQPWIASNILSTIWDRLMASFCEPSKMEARTRFTKCSQINSTYRSTQPTAVSRFYLQENDQNFKYQHCVLQEFFL